MEISDNVKKYRKDICEALEVELSSEDLDSDFFIGRFYGQEWDYLDSLSLINRGFCPIMWKRAN